MKVKRAKLSWLERLYIPSILNGFKVTMRHFFSWKRSEVYAEKQSNFAACANRISRCALFGKGRRQRYEVCLLSAMRICLSS